MKYSWEPKCVGSHPIELSEKQYKQMVAELADILYLHFAEFEKKPDTLPTWTELPSDQNRRSSENA